MNIKIYRWEIIDEFEIFTTKDIVDDDYEWKLIYEGNSVEEALFVLFQEKTNGHDIKLIWR